MGRPEIARAASRPSGVSRGPPAHALGSRPDEDAVIDGFRRSDDVIRSVDRQGESTWWSAPCGLTSGRAGESRGTRPCGRGRPGDSRRGAVLAGVVGARPVPRPPTASLRPRSVPGTLSRSGARRRRDVPLPSPQAVSPWSPPHRTSPPSGRAEAARRSVRDEKTLSSTCPRLPPFIEGVPTCEGGASSHPKRGLFGPKNRPDLRYLWWAVPGGQPSSEVAQGSPGR